MKVQQVSKVFFYLFLNYLDFSFYDKQAVYDECKFQPHNENHPGPSRYLDNKFEAEDILMPNLKDAG